MPKTPKNKAKINIQQPMMDEINPLLPFNQNPSLDSLEQIATEEIVKQHWLRQFKIWDSEEQSPVFLMRWNRETGDGASGDGASGNGVPTPLRRHRDWHRETAYLPG